MLCSAANITKVKSLQRTAESETKSLDQQCCHLTEKAEDSGEYLQPCQRLGCDSKDCVANKRID